VSRNQDSGPGIAEGGRPHGSAWKTAKRGGSSSIIPEVDPITEGLDGDDDPGDEVPIGKSVTIF